MSSGEDLKERYYCAVLAKAINLCEWDGVQFSDIYELICSQTTKEEGEEIKRKAHDLSNLPLHTLNHRVTWLEQFVDKRLHLSASKGDKVENIKADKEGNNSTVNLESTESVKSLFETDSNDAAISGDKLAKQCQQNMAFELEQSIQFIDEDADSDESVEPVLTSKNFNKKTEGQSPHMDENGNLVPEDGSSGSSVVNSAQSCIVDMPPIEELAVDKPVNFKYWERSPVLTPDDCRQERHAQHENAMIESYEMTEMQRSDLHDKFKDNGEMKSLAGVDSTIVTKKKVKKKKKAKSKATDVGRKPDQTATAASDEYINNGNSCMESVENKMEKMNNIGYIKNEASNLTDSLERQPLLGNNSFENSWSAGDTSNSSTKPKRRTIKKYQQEKEERKRQISYGSVDPNSKCHLPISKTKQSKAEKRKQDEMLKKEILTDEKVNSILQLCGDEATVSTESKKKFKENKQGVPKKDRKKTKKQKKGEKKKPCEQKKEDIVDVNLDVASQITEEVFAPAVGDPIPDDNSAEFVTQRRKRTPHKQTPSSGRAPLNTESASRFHKSSTASSSQSQSMDQSQPSSPSIIETGNQRNFEGIPTDEWPGLPSVQDGSNCNNLSSVNAASYASKLKSNLDSTGCSLASSSEDGSSTSSTSSSNYHPCSAGQLSPISDRHVTALSSMSQIIEKTADFLKDFLKTDTPQSTVKPILTEVEPVTIVDKPVKVVQKDLHDMPITDGVDTNASFAVNEKDEGAKIIKSQENFDNTNKKHLLENIPSVQESIEPFETTLIKNEDQSLSNNAERIEMENLSTANLNVICELDNKWGLNFFTDDYSTESLNENPPETVFIHAGDDEGEIRVTFGDNCDLTEINSKNVAYESQVRTEKVDSKAQSVGSSFSPLNMRLDENITKWNDPCDFDLEKATSVLMKEWRKVEKQAVYFEDLQ